VGREEMVVRSQLVSSTFVGMGRQSRKSEMSSSGEVEVWVGTTRKGVVCLAATVLTLVATFFFGFPAAHLVASVDLGLDFLGPAFFLVAVTLGCVGTSITG
jgi:hypothetical protein